MNRKDFLGRVASYGLCTSAGVAMGDAVLGAQEAQAGAPTEDKAKGKMAFWISDLVTSAKKGEERSEVARALESCGRGCFRRNMPPAAPEVKGNLDAFILHFQKALGLENVKRDGNVIHVRFPLESCVCPVASSVPVQPEDLFCNCSRGWLQAAFDVALNRIPRVECLESFRRGGRSCRFDVDVS